MRDFRYLDPDNWYRARLQGTPAGAVFLEKMHKGKLTTLDSAAAFPSDPDVLRVKCVGSALEVWYNPAGTPGAATLSATDGDIGWGGVALSGWDALFDNLKVGYDADDDDDLDGSDDVVISEDFAATSVSPTHDDAGNLTKDADYAYVFDAWNNLVKVRAQNDADVVVGVYAYYADNRRASKTVTNRGDLDGVTYFFYDGLREIEERNGAEAVTQQYVWGNEYLDQLLMIRGAGGTWFVHQDANWNVIALTTPNGDVAEEVQYQPYGLPQVKRHLAFGDSDADGDVDSADSTARTNALSTYNRAFDADFDGDVSNTSGDADQEAWDASYNDPAASTTMVIPNRSFSPTGNPFLFTGRRLDPETGLYFYRFRTYHPALKQFIQRDPLGYVDSASLYQYVGGRPTAAVDPLGLKIQLVGENIGLLLQAIQQVVPGVSMDGQGFLSLEKPGDNGTFSEWLLYMLIQQAQTIVIQYGRVKEDSPGKTEGTNITIDRNRMNKRFRTKDGRSVPPALWQVIFHELIHALNNITATSDKEFCVICATNKVTRDYNKRHPDKPAPENDPGKGNESDCPNYDDIVNPPEKPSPESNNPLQPPGNDDGSP